LIPTQTPGIVVTTSVEFIGLLQVLPILYD